MADETKTETKTETKVEKTEARKKPAIFTKIERLIADHPELAGELTEISEDLKTARKEATTRRFEVSDLEKQVREIAVERDGLSTKLEGLAPSALQAKVEELSGKLRGLSHRSAFEKVAKSHKVSDPAKVQDLWELSKYNPDSDTPDESKIGQTIQEAIKSRPWLVEVEAGASKAVPGGTNGVPVTREGPPGPGADRGQSVSSGQSATPGKIAGRL